MVETKDKVGPAADDYLERHEINWAGTDLNCTHEEKDPLTLKCPSSSSEERPLKIAAISAQWYGDPEEWSGEDYHETWFPHTHSPDSREDNATHQTTPEAGQDYHDTGYYHTHSPDSIEEGRNDSNNSKYDGANEAISKTLKELLKNIGKTKTKTGQDYHDTGFDHTHRPKDRRKNKHTRNKKTQRVKVT